jgi:hypothetical protein
MISFTVVFFMFMFFFALIGGLRGWAKEMLVTFSVVLTLFMVLVLERFSGGIVTPYAALDKRYGYITDVEVSDTDIVVLASEEITPFDELPTEAQRDYRRQFWIRTVVLLVLVFFGYQTIALTRLGGSVRREKLQDFLLGLFLGAINGYFIIGTIWSYMHSSHYPFYPNITVPNNTDPLISTANTLINILPPIWLGTTPVIFIAVGLCFLFVLVVFI